MARPLLCASTMEDELNTPQEESRQSSARGSREADVESAIRERYTRAAHAPEAALCCSVDYDPAYLRAIPRDVVERDYGCGDPSRYVREGDVVLDLGSGGGKICFIASQIVGPTGRVVGVDENVDMLALARRATKLFSRRIGYANVEFCRGRIQDLALDLDLLNAWLEAHPVRTLNDLQRCEEHADRLRRQNPLVADESVDVVVSNCVLNLVREAERVMLAREIFRVLRPGGRIAISDIVSDRPVPDDLKADPALWSGCVSGAFHERELLQQFEEAGFHGLVLDRWTEEPFATVDGIEFRAVTVTGRKGEAGVCSEEDLAVIYRGPWRRVEDDEGHVFPRGERVLVCSKTRDRLLAEPYQGQVIYTAGGPQSEGSPPGSCC